MSKTDDKKGKKGVAIIIAVGGKPPKPPTKTLDPDEKKKMDAAWRFLKNEDLEDEDTIDWNLSNANDSNKNRTGRQGSDAKSNEEDGEESFLEGLGQDSGRHAKTRTLSEIENNPLGRHLTGKVPQEQVVNANERMDNIMREQAEKEAEKEAERVKMEQYFQGIVPQAPISDSDPPNPFDNKSIPMSAAWDWLLR